MVTVPSSLCYLISNKISYSLQYPPFGPTGSGLGPLSALDDLGDKRTKIGVTDFSVLIVREESGPAGGTSLS